MALSITICLRNRLKSSKVRFKREKRLPEGVPSIKQVCLPKNQKEYEQFCSYSFSHSCHARYSVLHLLGVLSGGDEPPFTQGSPFMFIYDLSISLTSTAFVDTKAKPRARLGKDYDSFCLVTINAFTRSHSFINFG